MWCVLAKIDDGWVSLGNQTKGWETENHGAKDRVEGGAQTMLSCRQDQTPWCYISCLCLCVWTVHSWIKARAGLHSYQVQVWFNHSRNDCAHCDSVFLFWTSVQRVRRRASSLLLLVELCTLYYLWRHYSWVCMPEANLLWRLCVKRHTCWWLCHEDIQHVFFGLGLTAWSHSDQT